METCDVCGLTISKAYVTKIGKHTVCIYCERKVITRLDEFWTLLTAPEDEFERWLQDEHPEE